MELLQVLSTSFDWTFPAHRTRITTMYFLGDLLHGALNTCLLDHISRFADACCIYEPKQDTMDIYLFFDRIPVVPKLSH